MYPNTSRFYGRVAKLQKLLSFLGLSEKEKFNVVVYLESRRDSNFFAVAIGL